MNTLHKIDYRASSHSVGLLDVLRIALGLYLIYKGLVFIGNPEVIMGLTGSSDMAFVTISMAHYIAFAHMIGGIFITVGLFTRVASLIQLPILIGAVFFVNPKGFFSLAYNMEFWISLVVLILLCIFIYAGSGRFSVSDHTKFEKY